MGPGFAPPQYIYIYIYIYMKQTHKKEGKGYTLIDFKFSILW